MEMERMSALKLGEAIRQRKVSCAEAVKQALSQIQKQDGKLHAFLDVYEEEALARAKEMDQEIAKGSCPSPLAGVPVAVKDNICFRGKRTTCGSRMLEHFIAPYQAEAADRLEAAGMILIGKTNMDEFAMGSTTETSAFGSTRNPWNPEHVPGGSSGGSAAAVAAGETPLAVGSDTGGSIRQPSAYCGVVGLKPTYGTVSRYGLVAYASSMDQIGPIGSSAADCAALLEVLAGYDRKDSTSVKREDLNFSEGLGKGIRGMRIGVPKEFLAGEMEDEVRQSFLEAMKILVSLGAQVNFFSMKTVKYMIPAYYLIACAEASSNLERYDGVKYGFRAQDYDGLHDMYKKTRTQGFGEEVKRRIMLGSFVLSSGYYEAYYLKALRTRAVIKQEFDQIFREYALILAPASPDAAPVLGESLKDPMKMYLSDIHTVAVNLCGLPAVSVPCGLTRKGLPVGIQFIGNCFQEKTILQAADAYEKARGEFGVPEGRKEKKG